VSTALDRRRTSAPRAGAGIAILLAGVWLRRAVRWICRRAPATAAGLAASIPVLVSAIHAAVIGWEPAGDDGIIVTRGFDVLTSHSPLVGQYSESGYLTGQIVHSPGPLLYWLLAIPARFLSVSGIPVWMGIVNTLAIVATVALARRRGGLVLMFAAAIAIALMCQSLPSESFHDVWNPAAGLFPFLLLIFLCWSVACGERRLLPATALVASFVTQTHLTYVAPTIGMAAIAVLGFGAGLWHRRWRPPGLRRWVLATLAVVLVCWAPPLLDEIEHSPGNLALLAETTGSSQPRLGADVGWHAVVRAVGITPWWLYQPHSEWNRKADVRQTPSSARADSAIAILAILGLICAIALARRRRDLASAAALALVMAGALDVNVAQTPNTTVLAATVGYTAWWGSILGMWAYLVIAWALWSALLALLARRGSHRRVLATAARWWRRRRLTLVASLLCLGGAAATGTAVASTETPDSHYREYEPIARIVAALDRSVPRGVTVRYSLGAQSVSTQPMEPAIRYGLVRHGDTPLSKGALQRLGTHYELVHQHYSWFVYIADGAGRVARMVRVVTVRFRTGFGENVFSAYVATVAPSGRLEPRLG
jgi:hypothetical protein